MPDHATTELHPKWQLIQERLKIKDLAEWLRPLRAGTRDSNPQWMSWDAIVLKIYDQTRVRVTVNGLRARWAEVVDVKDAGDPVPPTEAAGSPG